MAKIETGRFSEVMRRFLQLKGTEVVSGELSPEVSPVFVLEDDRPDWSFLKGERLVAGGADIAAAVGAGTVFRVRNPTDSGVIATFRRWYVSIDTAGERIILNVGAHVTDHVNLQTLINRDTRWPGLRRSALIGSWSDASGPAGDLLWLGLSRANTIEEIDIPMVLTPGFGFDIGVSFTANIAMQVIAYWDERPLPAIEAG